jgi:hypothetical protein
MLSLEMMPAAYGDALLVRWGTTKKTYNMLIDAGPLSTYRGIHDRVKALGKAPRFELVVVTHIDGDHIEGMIRLMQDRIALGIDIGDFWFNGWPQLPTSDRQGADYGEMIGALLLQAKLPWNAAFDGGPVMVPDDGPLPVHTLAGGAKVTVVGAGRTQLLALRKQWTKVLAEVGVTPGKPEEALKRLANRKELSGLDVQGGSIKLDNSVANGSSIALLFEYKGQSLLLTGDSYGSVVAAGVQRLIDERNEGQKIKQTRLKVDAFKLPHHCSQANVTDDLLELVDTTRFLVSTNGAKYKHPDKAAVLRVVSGPGRDGPVELVFNYLSATTEPWDVAATEKKYHYTADFPTAEAPGATVTL